MEILLFGLAVLVVLGCGGWLVFLVLATVLNLLFPPSKCQACGHRNKVRGPPGWGERIAMGILGAALSGGMSLGQANESARVAFEATRGGVQGAGSPDDRWWCASCGEEWPEFSELAMSAGCFGCLGYYVLLCLGCTGFLGLL